MANRAIVYRLYPDKEQDILLRKTFGCARLVYNTILATQIERYEQGQKRLSKDDANNHCNKNLKKEFPFLKEVDKFALTNSIYHVDTAYKRFFEHLGGFPKFKAKHISRKSYTTNYTNGNIKVGDGYVQLPKLGKVKAVIHRLPKDGWAITSATVAQNKDGSYQVSVLFEYDKTAVQPASVDTADSIGLDYKSDGLYTDSNGSVCGMPHYFMESQPRLAKAQRRLKGMKQGSHNYARYRKRIARIHRHIANQRKDFLHKQSSAITKQYDTVCVENLNMRAMSDKAHGNGKATLDNGYGMFLDMLEYKLAEKGGHLVRVDKWYPSSQICCRCGERHPEMKNLRIRRMYCRCGNTIDRDYNAALNIQAEGIRMLTA